MPPLSSSVPSSASSSSVLRKQTPPLPGRPLLRRSAPSPSSLESDRTRAKRLQLASSMSHNIPNVHPSVARPSVPRKDQSLYRSMPQLHSSTAKLRVPRKNHYMYRSMALEQQTIWEETENLRDQGTAHDSLDSFQTQKQTNVSEFPVNGSDEKPLHRSMPQSSMTQQMTHSRIDPPVRRNSMSQPRMEQQMTHSRIDPPVRRNSINTTIAQQTALQVGPWKSWMARLGSKPTVAEQSRVAPRANQPQGPYHVQDSMTKQGTVDDLPSQMKQVLREDFDPIRNDATSSVTSSGSSIATDSSSHHHQPMKLGKPPANNYRLQFAATRRLSAESARHITRLPTGEAKVYKRAELNRSTAALDLPPL